jgi:hypothetical protein
MSMKNSPKAGVHRAFSSCMAFPTSFLSSHTVQASFWRRSAETVSALGLLLVLAKSLTFLAGAGWGLLFSRHVSGIIDLLVNIFLLALQVAFCLFTFGFDLLAFALAFCLVYNLLKPLAGYTPPFTILGNTASWAAAVMARFW